MIFVTGFQVQFMQAYDDTDNKQQLLTALIAKLVGYLIGFKILIS